MSGEMIDQPQVHPASPVDFENGIPNPDVAASFESTVQGIAPETNIRSTTDIGSTKIAGLQFHHIGIACRDIDAELRALAMVGYELEGERFSDPLQKIQGCFLVGPGPRVELLTPMDDSSPIISWLEKGVKMYHQAYEVESIEQAIATLAAQRAVVLSRAKPAVAFGGRKIVFLMFPNCLLVELIEL
jgi:methylmalonyl-CoA/ethylmalonyl-CoA epimerase